MKPAHTAWTSNAAPLVMPSAACTRVAVAGKVRSGVAVASEKAAVPLSAFDFTRPAAVVIGNEGRGPRPELMAACDALVSIPQFGRIGSLNASVAAGICFYEAMRQRKNR